MSEKEFELLKVISSNYKKIIGKTSLIITIFGMFELTCEKEKLYYFIMRNINSFGNLVEVYDIKGEKNRKTKYSKSELQAYKENPFSKPKKDLNWVDDMKVDKKGTKITL